MRLIETLVSLYAPHTCLGCGTEQDVLLCEACRFTVPVTPSRCYRCKATTREYGVCETCRKHTPLRHVYVATYYDGLAKELLHCSKYERASKGLEEVARFMQPLLPYLPKDVQIVPVPTATSRVRQRGYDQAAVMARELARAAGLRLTTALARTSQAHQVGSGRSERILHLKGAFRVVRGGELAGARIVLVDDVLTTGATLETAARLLKKAGAKQVDALVFAQPG